MKSPWILTKTTEEEDPFQDGVSPELQEKWNRLRKAIKENTETHAVKSVTNQQVLALLKGFVTSAPSKPGSKTPITSMMPMESNLKEILSTALQEKIKLSKEEIKAIHDAMLRMRQILLETKLSSGVLLKAVGLDYDGAELAEALDQVERSGGTLSQQKVALFQILCPHRKAATKERGQEELEAHRVGELNPVQEDSKRLIKRLLVEKNRRDEPPELVSIADQNLTQKPAVQVTLPVFKVPLCVEKTGINKGKLFQKFLADKARYKGKPKDEQFSPLWLWTWISRGVEQYEEREEMEMHVTEWRRELGKKNVFETRSVAGSVESRINDPAEIAAYYSDTPYLEQQQVQQLAEPEARSLMQVPKGTSWGACLFRILTMTHGLKKTDRAELESHVRAMASHRSKGVLSAAEKKIFEHYRIPAGMEYLLLKALGAPLRIISEAHFKEKNEAPVSLEQWIWFTLGELMEEGEGATYQWENLILNEAKLKKLILLSFNIREMPEAVEALQHWISDR